MAERMTRRDRVTITMVFAVHGMVGASFVTRIPWISQHLDLSPGQLGVALLCPAAGAFLLMPTAARVVHRLGYRAATRLLIVLLGASLALPALMPNLATLCVALFLYGAAAGTSDVAMNALAVVIERGLGRPIMSGLHGWWSVGSLAAAGLGAGVTYAGMDARVHLPAMAALLAVAGWWVCSLLPSPSASTGDVKPPKFTLPGKAIIGVGLVGFCGSLIEGATHDWSTVFLSDVVGTNDGTAAVGFGVFAGTMALARITGDAVVRRFGGVRTVRVGGAVTAGGALLVAATRHPVPVIAGFVLIALGIAVTIPLAISAASRTSAVPSQGISSLVTIMYTSGLVSPSVMGAVADLTSLPWSFVMLGVIALVMLSLAGSVGRHDAKRDAEVAVS
ncbi:MFS transporter [Actinorhabdospora filicis]|uniref:MFS transporter n=1 Tax=Actinorhabdospora filicis TaxID=1785913 RepID=A0A9W6SHF1_9ACTN|nr:MFS transporter [Actinorhabdospora filicis]GLZ76017.1 MFS transporter [Actinorhabdospora filicis]